ncbi:CNH-domain-containing protein [Pleurotus eryngii]|uniref:CNH-domain-containing protein n=1 Tax=Pleurotus eryngii TaxID=5323 RepID=A0A9P6A604_PLEER|nr:CNH-domain-containing protein [Pleurotus eryngii]
MDKPLGPRQQPDKRNAAYESIFGRPSASHHHLQPPSSFSQPYSTPPLLGQHLPYQQPYQAQVDRRASFTPSLVPSPQIPVLSNQQLPTNPNSRQSYYPPPQPQAQLPQGLPSSPYPAHHHHHHHHSPPPNLVAPHSDHHGRANSVASTSHSSNIGIIQPPPEEPVQTQNGLTPAQVYRAQVSLNSPNDSQGDWSRFRNSSERQLAPSYQDPPRIGVDLDPDDGKLGIDFGQGGNSSEQSTDDGSSELPWAVQEPRSLMAYISHLDVMLASPPSSKAPLSPRFSIDSDHSSRHPLQVQTNMPSDSAVLSAKTSPTSSTTADYTSILSSSAYVTGRRSSDSARTTPRLLGPRRERGPQDRSMSMSAASLRPTSTSRPPIPNHQGRDSPTSIRLPVRKTPIVYPALISCVAEAFRERILVGDRVKDGLTYKNSFDGREAVDKIAYIIKTTDRNLALLLGRSLDAQKFFHDVTYDHRLRDSSNELYQFQTRVRSPFTSGELENGVEQGSGDEKNAKPPEDDSGSPSPAGSSTPQIQQQQEGALPSVDEITALPTGVFTLLTDCYSPTCSRDRLCYSIACPRRLEQQARLNMKPQPGLSKQISRESLGDVPDAGTLWIHSVPPEIVNSVSDTEKKRQEAINEVIYTERDFVRDLEYLRDVWINQLKDSDIIAAERRTDFLEQVFWNIHDIIAVNTRLRDALNKRQKSYAVVERIGDILLDAVPHFGPFVSYGAHQLYGKYEFEKEKNSNPAFAQFVEMTERLPESRKLELNAYLTKPTTRLARYPLLLQAVLKHTPEDSPDKIILPKVIALVKEFLGKVNAESGKTENRFNLLQLEQQLFFRPGEEVDLRLKEEGRQLMYKNPLNKRDGEIQVYLFDHALLFAKAVKTKQHEQYKVYRRPIPLELLLISAPEDAANATVRSQNHRNRGLVKRASFNGKVSPNVPAAKSESKGSHWITFMHLGRKYYHLTLWATSAMGQRKWLENIYKQQQVMRERSMIFDTVTLSEGFFSGPTNKVNCAAPFNGGRCVVYGTDDGVYISDLMVNREPVKVLGLLEVAQVDVLEDYQLLIVLSERQVITFPLDALDPNDPVAGLKRAKRISSHTSFFKAGYCLGKVLVCIVKSSQLSSTFKTLEPIDQNIRGRSKPTFRKLLQGGNDTLKMFKEFYIPVESTSIHYLKTKMCVGCSRGFEIVDLESLDTQGLLDPQDESLDFVRKKENLRPMAIYRIGNEFLLCYDEFAFYVNKNGRRSRKDFMVYWEGLPSGFALHEPYVLAFEPSFVEIRHIETGLLSQVIQGNNLRLLFADTPPSVSNNHHYASSVEYGYNPYAASTNSYGSRQSAYNAFGVPPQQMAYPNPNQYPRPPQGVGRDEILIVSDDRVLALRPAAGLHRFMGDNLSQVSIPR